MGIKRRKSKKGFTVIEAIISLTLFTMIMIPLGSFTLTAIKNTAKSSEKQKAMDVAQSMVEQIKSVDSSNIDNLDEKSVLNLGNSNSIEVKKEYKNNKFKNYSISGNISGFEVAGNITPNDAYVNKDENVGNKNFDYYLYINNGEILGSVNSNLEEKIKLGQLNSDNNGQIIISEESNGDIKINNNYISSVIANQKDFKIKITDNKSTNGKININLSNQNTNNILGVYCYKNLGSSLTYNDVPGEASSGITRLYENLYNKSPNESGSNLFNIDIKILKKNQLIYEINSTKVIKE
ncbi:type IV pilus modification PilV family protein [Clostridium sp. B9]|uniref:type IV pilus modification PilV family protein n=1 Tax=Clostridium sp. B9 TaxID=3423224 RepID=UPI003D2EAE46